MGLVILKNIFAIIAYSPEHRQILTKESQHFTVSREKRSNGNPQSILVP